MAKDEDEFGGPTGRVAPTSKQLGEPSPWHLLYDLNASIARVDEAVSHLKEKATGTDRRIEEADKKLDKIVADVNQAKGSLRTLVYVLAVAGPVITLILESILKRLKLF